MASFQQFQHQAQLQSQKSTMPNDSLSLSVVLGYAETARKQSFEAFCRTHPLVKTYRDKVQQTSQAMSEAGSKLGEEVELPTAYSAALTAVKDSFALHLRALDDWLGAFAQKDEPSSLTAMASVKQSGEQLQAGLGQLSSVK